MWDDVHETDEKKEEEKGERTLSQCWREDTVSTLYELNKSKEKQWKNMHEVDDD